MCFLCAGMPTCLLCVCISGSVYCDDTGLDQIPPLPKDTTHFYGRFNKIRHVKNTDFINLSEESRSTHPPYTIISLARITPQQYEVKDFNECSER